MCILVFVHGLHVVWVCICVHIGASVLHGCSHMCISVDSCVTVQIGFSVHVDMVWVNTYM